MEPQWLTWARRLDAIAQIGLTYANNDYDHGHYTEIRDIAAEIMATHSSMTFEQARHIHEEDAGYVTPKVDVRGVVFRGQDVLLVKEREDGLWTVPGGWADIGEAPGEGVAREVREESGYTVRAVKLLAVYDRLKHPHPPHVSHIYKLFFLCELTGGAPASSVETEEVGFFPVDALPPLSTARVLPQQIARFYEHYRNPSLPTDFD